MPAFVHLGLQLNVPADWQNASTLLVVGPVHPQKKDLADVITVRVLPADVSLLDALNEHSGSQLEGVELLRQEEVSLTLGEGKKAEVALQISGEALVRTTLVVNKEDHTGLHHLVVASITQSRVKYDAGEREDVDAFIETLQWANDCV